MGTRLFIRNLSPKTTEAELYELFAQVGKVSLIHLPIDFITGDNKNHGTVEMATIELANEAVRKVNGRVLNGRGLQVTVNRPPDLRSSPI
jgi:RNA recognition motif-containing protein